MARIYHLALPDDWVAAQAEGSYRVSTRGMSLDQVGFVHASFPHQVPVVRRNFYGDVAGPLTLLEIDPERLTAPLVVEVGDPETGEEFPHILGPLNVDAVLSARDLPEPHGREDVAVDEERVVARPRDVVWARLTDWASMPRWVPGVRDLVEGGPVAEGTMLVFGSEHGDRSARVSCVWPEFLLTITTQRAAVRADYTFALADAPDRPPGGATVVRLIAQVAADLSDAQAQAVRARIGVVDATQLDRLAAVLEG